MSDESCWVKLDGLGDVRVRRHVGREICSTEVVSGEGLAGGCCGEKWEAAGTAFRCGVGSGGVRFW